MKYIEYKGGLGDIIRHIYDENSDTYEGLIRLAPHERITIGFICANPGVKELVLWHPKRSQIDIFSIEYQDPWLAEQRIVHGLPEIWSPYNVRRGPIFFYPNPADHPTLVNVLRFRPYIVIAASASVDNRNFPVEITERVVSVAIRHGYSIVTVGRNYENWNSWGGRRFMNPHQEVRVAARDGVFDTIDRLSFPGTARIVEMASGVVCCNSAIMHLSWCMKKPTFALTSKDNWNGEYLQPNCGIFWGRAFPTTRCFPFYEYTDEGLVEWIEKSVRPQTLR